MALWTDFITPQELTGYVRADLEDYEIAKGTLARWLPNRQIADTVVRFFVGQAGLVDEARYRAYDAAPETGRVKGGKRVTVEIPALSLEVPVSEYNQLRGRQSATDSQIRQWIINAAVNLARGVADRTERQRGTVLATGTAIIAQDNFAETTDFGRDASMTTTIAHLWSDPDSDRIGDLEALTDHYVTVNGDEPGCMVMSKRAFRGLQSGTQFATQLLNGASRPATADQVRSTIEGAGLPPIILFDRKTSGGRVLPEKTVLMLPAPGDTADEAGAPLGSTFWGQTLTSTDPAYGLAGGEQPGVVLGAYRGEKPPMIAEVIVDAMSMPVLANGDLSMAFNVFA